MPYLQPLAVAQLVRLPNVFTAFADIALALVAGAAVAPTLPENFGSRAVLLASASGSLYLAGMVWNDVFDRVEDATARPFRPIPSGRVALRTAVTLGVVLLALGPAFAGLATIDGERSPLWVALGLAAAVLAYDGLLKPTVAGPFAMAACRFLNVLLGLSIFPTADVPMALRVQLAGVVGVYILGVTWFARTEEGRSHPLRLGVAAAVIAASLGGALLLRAGLAAPPTAVLFPYLLVLFGFVIGGPIARAIARPGPHEVQAAVKRCVLGLIGLDAVLATAFAGVAGLLILFLLPPAVVIGKWVYST